MSEQKKRYQYTLHVIGEGADEYRAWDEAVDTLKALPQDEWPEWQKVRDLCDEDAEKIKKRDAAADVTDLVDELDDIAADYGDMMCMDEDDHEKLTRVLMDDHDWSREGAEVQVQLATKYGSFVLRNALALAIVLDIEDGTEGP